MKLITLNILSVHNYLKNGLFFLVKTLTSKPTWKCSSKSRPLLHGNFFILVVQARHKSSPKIRRYHVCGRLKKRIFEISWLKRQTLLTPCIYSHYCTISSIYIHIARMWHVYSRWIIKWIIIMIKTWSHPVGLPPVTATPRHPIGLRT